MKLDEWSQKVIEPTTPVSNLVMIFPNARAIGLAATTKFRSIKLGKLHDLVGRRNEIGHGAVIEPPSNENFIELWKFTEELIDDYCDSCITWMQQPEHSDC